MDSDLKSGIFLFKDSTFRESESFTVPQRAILVLVSFIFNIDTPSCRLVSLTFTKNRIATVSSIKHGLWTYKSFFSENWRSDFVFFCQLQWTLMALLDPWDSRLSYCLLSILSDWSGSTNLVTSYVIKTVCAFCVSPANLVNSLVKLWKTTHQEVSTDMWTKKPQQEKSSAMSWNRVTCGSDRGIS